MLLLQPDGLVLHANLAAQEMLIQDCMVGLTADGYLAARSAARRGDFQSALAGAAGGQAQQLSWAEGDMTLHASLRPLSAPTVNAPAPPVLMMLAPSPDALFDASGFATIYGLSAAERRVLEALLHGHKAQTAADRLGVGVATVRSQIAAIRKKTGHPSVASLLAALGDLPPLRRDQKEPGAQGKKITER